MKTMRTLKDTEMGTRNNKKYLQSAQLKTIQGTLVSAQWKYIIFVGSCSKKM